MNTKIVFVCATVAALAGVSQAIFFTSTAAGTAGTVTLSSGGAAALAVGGALLLKAAAVGLILASRGRRRGRRDAVEPVDTFALIAQIEPEQCYRRLICDLATGKMADSDNNVILSLFNDDVTIEKPKFEFATAARLGKLAKDIKVCELRYSCPISGKELDELVN